MIATCQFCKLLIVGPEVVTFVRTPDAVRHEYRQLSMIVAAHMSSSHPTEAGQEIQLAMALAGGAIAMRFVESSDPQVDSERVAAADLLIASFSPAPAGPLVSLAA
jgi:hypothetical protein